MARRAWAGGRAVGIAAGGCRDPQVHRGVLRKVAGRDEPRFILWVDSNLDQLLLGDLVSEVLAGAAECRVVSHDC